MLNVQDHKRADAVLVNADDQVLDGLLARERAFWLGSARSLGLTGPGGVDSVVAAQAVAVACLIGVADEGAAVRTLARVPGMADASAGSRRKIARWIQQIYPPELSRLAGPEPSWWGSLVPTCWLSGMSPLSLPPRPIWPQGACEA
jgi:hypothetical protein